MKYSYKEVVIFDITLGDIVNYSKTKNVNYLKGLDHYKVASELFETKELRQIQWKALNLLDNSLFNKKRAAAYKKHFHYKYDYILSQIGGRKQHIINSDKLMKGIHLCLEENSDLPFYEDFMNDYFFVYDIDSIIDFAYTLSEEEKEMCKKLLIASIQCYEDKKFSAIENKSTAKKEKKFSVLTKIYLDIRYQDEIWDNNENVIDYLKTYYKEAVKWIIFPYNYDLVSKKDKKILRKYYPNFDVDKEKKRFLTLVEKAQNELSLENKDSHDGSDWNGGIVKTDKERNTTLIKTALQSALGKTLLHNQDGIESLDKPITEDAKEVSLDILPNTETAKRGKVGKAARLKGDIDYSEQQKISQKIGERGEELVLRNELAKLNKWGLSEELISKVRRVSLESDDYGYDILSFDQNGNEHYIEVKTTKQSNSDLSFILTQNELKHAKMYGSSYSIVIVFDILRNPRIWYMGNPFIEEPYKVTLTPVQYRVDVKTKQG